MLQDIAWPADDMPMTLQVGMVASDGWVLASDERSTLQGPGWVRQTYVTDKILCRSGVATLAWGDECAIIARQKILDNLQPRPDTIDTDEFQESARELAINVWRQNPDYPQERSRGIVFASVGHRKLWHLSFGQLAVVHDQATKCAYGDPANPISFFSEEYHKPERTVDELTFLAAHIVVAGARYNAMIGGLKVIVWRWGKDMLESVDSAPLEAKSNQFKTALDDFVLKVMRS